MSSVLIVAGGTGGHVFPALAVARELIRQGLRVAWLGTRRGLESRLVPESGLPIAMSWMGISGVRGGGIGSWIAAPVQVLRAILQAISVVRRERPDAVLAMGGYTAGPGGIAARLMGVPLVVHEQNAIPGFTNRVLAWIARRTLAAFPTALGGGKAEVTGNPVRAEIVAIAPPAERLASRHGRLRLLVVGGSQGAQALNDRVPAAVQRVAEALRPEVWHQCGRGREDATRAAYGSLASVRVAEFITDMADAYAWADLVVCRSGAMTVAELACAGLPSVLVPYPHAVDDHQTANARYLTERGAAVLMAQADLSAELLAARLTELAQDRGRIITMAEAARASAVTDAADRIARACREVMHA